MEITDVRVFPVESEKLCAFVSVVLDGCFMVNDIKVIRGRDGLFISMPSRKKRNGEFKDVAHPLNQETRRRFEERILEEYRVRIEGGSALAATAGVEPETAAVAVDPRAAKEDSSRRSLEEVEREHLNDSFWGVS